MAKNYNVDDILEEIKRKKSSAAGTTVTEPPQRYSAHTGTAQAEPTPQRETVFKSTEKVATSSRQSVFSSRAEEESGGSRRISSRAPQPIEELEQQKHTMKTIPTQPNLDAELQARLRRLGIADEQEPELSAPQESSVPNKQKFQLKVDLDQEESKFEREKTQLNMPRPVQKVTEDSGHLTRAIQPGSSSTDSSLLPDLQELRSNRAEKIRNFVLDSEEEEDRVPKASPAQNTQEDADDELSEEIEEYNSYDDTESVQKDIATIKSNLTVRLGISAVCFGVLTYLAVSLMSKSVPLPEFMWPETHMNVFLLVNLGITILAAVVCNVTVGGGLMSLFKLKADRDSFAALAVLAVVIQGVALVMHPEQVGEESIHLYFAVAVLGLVFNTIGKLLMINRIQRNFKLVSSNVEKSAVLQVKDKDISREFTRGLGVDGPAPVLGVKTKFLSNFLDISYSDECYDGLNRVLVPICFVGSIAVAVVSYLLLKDIYITLTAFAATLCICSPITAAIVENLPLARATKKLSRHGAMIGGFSTLEEYAGTNAVVLKDSELFPQGFIILHGIKMFRENLVDQTIQDAASIMHSCGGTLSGVFMDTIGSDEKMVKKVENLVYEDGMGISAWVDGKRVLMGNRELMIHHGIDIPSRDYEMKFLRDSRELLYLSNSGELMGMFVMSYEFNEEIAAELDRLADRNIHLVVCSNDPNVTADRIAETYAFPKEMIRVLPAKSHGDYDNLAMARDRAKAALAYTGSSLSMLKAINAVFSVRSSITAGTVIQILSIVLGYFMIVLFAFMGSMSTVTFWSLILYQMFWAAAVFVVSRFTKA